MIMGMSYLRSPAYAAVGDAKTHELYLKLAEITSDTAMNDVFLALLAQSSQSHHHSYSRRLVQASILSSFLFAFLATLGKLVMGRNGFYLNMLSRRSSRRKFFLRPLPSISRRFIPVLKRLPNAFLLNQLLLGLAFIVAHHLAL